MAWCRAREPFGVDPVKSRGRQLKSGWEKVVLVRFGSSFQGAINVLFFFLLLIPRVNTKGFFISYPESG
jgi:hypothetical protein